MGCTLRPCCGGYVIEGHMSDCAIPSDERVFGRYSNLSYQGPAVDQPRRDHLIEAIETVIKRLSSARAAIRNDYNDRLGGGLTYVGIAGSRAALRDVEALAESFLPLFEEMRELVNYAIAERAPEIESLRDGMSKVACAVEELQTRRRPLESHA
jgi:hypothetical protein